MERGDPGKLRGCVGDVAELDDRGNAAAALARIVQELKTLDEKRQRVVELYASEQMVGADYIAESRALDEELYHLTREKAGIVKGMRVPQHDDFVGSSAPTRRRGLRRAPTSIRNGASLWITSSA